MINQTHTPVDEIKISPRSILTRNSSVDVVFGLLFVLVEYITGEIASSLRKRYTDFPRLSGKIVT
jgi:hypothetical protein